MAAPLVIAVVHLIVRLEILALQVKSGPPRDRPLWLRPQAALWESGAFDRRAANEPRPIPQRSRSGRLRPRGPALAGMRVDALTPTPIDILLASLGGLLQTAKGMPYRRGIFLPSLSLSRICASMRVAIISSVLHG